MLNTKHCFRSFGVIIVVLILIVLGLGAYFWSQKKVEAPPPTDVDVPADNSFTTLSATTTDISTWKTYRNEECGFEFKYPSGWKVDLWQLGTGSNSPSKAAERLRQKLGRDPSPFEVAKEIGIETEWISYRSDEVNDMLLTMIFYPEGKPWPSAHQRNAIEFGVKDLLRDNALEIGGPDWLYFYQPGLDTFRLGVTGRSEPEIVTVKQMAERENIVISHTPHGLEVWQLYGWEIPGPFEWFVLDRNHHRLFQFIFQVSFRLPDDFKYDYIPPIKDSVNRSYFEEVNQILSTFRFVK